MTAVSKHQEEGKHSKVYYELVDSEQDMSGMLAYAFYRSIEDKRNEEIKKKKEKKRLISVIIN